MKNVSYIKKVSPTYGNGFKPRYRLNLLLKNFADVSVMMVSKWSASTSEILLIGLKQTKTKIRTKTI